MKKFIFLILLLTFTALSILPATAQDDGAESDFTVSGIIQKRLEGGGSEQYEGVEILVESADGSFSGTAITGADGRWSLSLPSAGDYTATLVAETLPEGAALRNPDLVSVEFSPTESRPDSGVLFGIESQSTSNNDIEVVQLLVDGVKLGLIIGMSAIGLSLIFGTTGLVNFAHGEMVTFGAIITYLLNRLGIGGWTTHLLIAAPIVVILSGAASGMFNEVVWRPLRRRGSSLISMLVVSIGLSIFFRYVFLYFFGGRALFYSDYQIQERWDFGPFSLVPKDVFIIVFSFLVLVLVGVLLQTTRIGKAMRAVADNRDLAASSGIDVEKVIRVVWVAGGALAGMGGILLGVTESVGWEMGFRQLLLMFAGVTLGGLGTAYGALLGSLVVGILIQTSTLVVPPDLKNLGALLALALILLIRPQGLLGRTERVG